MHNTKIPESEVSPIEIGIPAEQRADVCSRLASVLADQHVLYIKMRSFHWNLVGERFYTLHEFYEKQYTELEKSIDETAERIRQLGGVAPGSMSEFLDLSSLNEAAGELIEGEDSIVALVGDHEKVIRNLREYIGFVEDKGDMGTADFMTSLLQSHEEMAWMLRSFVRKA